MTPATLLIPLAVLAAAAGLGWLGHRQPPGKHARSGRLQWPSWLLNWAWHRQATPHRRSHDVDAARTVAWVSRIEQHHEISPAAAAQIQAHVMGKLAERIQPVATLPSWAEPATGPIWPAAYEPVPAASGPVPAAMADVDGDRPWEYATGQWPAYMDSIEGEQ